VRHKSSVSFPASPPKQFLVTRKSRHAVKRDS